MLSLMEKNITTETRRHREKQMRIAKSGLRTCLPVSPSPFLPIFFALCLCVSVMNLSCGSKPTDLRTVIPADSLVYLETNDLGKALTAVTENEAFKAAAKTQPDFSALAGIKLAAAVTGFETKEQQVTEENAVLKVQPRFVAVVETNAWNYQALNFTENKLGEFINETYGGEVVLETSDKHDGKYFVWSSGDGRKTYALVRGSVILFGNDESAIEKCLAVMRGETDSIAKNPKVTVLSADSLASGYVSTDGVTQIANIVGLKFANEAGEVPEVQSAIAGILPKLLQTSITEISWTATLTERGIEDKYEITTSTVIAQVFSETLLPSESSANVEVFAPANAASVTRYDLKDLRVAWRSLLITAQKQTDPFAGIMLAEFSNAFFEPYGIADPELFLASVRSSIMTVRLDDDGEKIVVIASIDDEAKMKRAISKEVDFSQAPTKMHGEQMWHSKDRSLAFVRQMGFALIGEPQDIQSCIDAGYGSPGSHLENFSQFAKRKALAITIANERTIATAVAAVLSEKKSDDAQVSSTYFTETRFAKTGIERRTVSDFGLIGSIIEQLGKDD